MNSEGMWLLIAYAVGSFSSFFLFRTMYTDFITGQLISMFEREGLVRVVKDEAGEMHVRPFMEYEEFVDILMEEIVKEQERRAQEEDKL